MCPVEVVICWCLSQVAPASLLHTARSECVCTCSSLVTSVCVCVCVCRGVLDKLGLVGQPQRRNPTSSTEIVGNIAVPEAQQSDTVALCTLDGGSLC